jgi:hypothetical protein
MASITQHCAFPSWSSVHYAGPCLSKSIPRGLRLPECFWEFDSRTVGSLDQLNYGKDLLDLRSRHGCSSSRPHCQDRVRTAGSACIHVDKTKHSSVCRPFDLSKPWYILRKPPIDHRLLNQKILLCPSQTRSITNLSRYHQSPNLLTGISFICQLIRMSVPDFLRLESHAAHRFRRRTIPYDPEITVFPCGSTTRWFD